MFDLPDVRVLAMQLVKASGDTYVTPNGTGFVRLVNYMGNDLAVVRAARVSTGNETITLGDREVRLIKYLMKHRHTSPFEHVVFTFHVKAPIFTARQWMRHRTGSFNERSARYSEMEDDFFIPDEFLTQSETNKQASGVPLSRRAQDEAFYVFNSAYMHAYDAYRDLLGLGVSREEARMVLPVNLYTEFYWTVNLHNLLHFVGLRMTEHAQKNIREYAVAVFELAREAAPVSCDAWLGVQ